MNPAKKIEGTPPRKRGGSSQIGSLDSVLMPFLIRNHCSAISGGSFFARRLIRDDGPLSFASLRVWSSALQFPGDGRA